MHMITRIVCTSSMRWCVWSPWGCEGPLTRSLDACGARNTWSIQDGWLNSICTLFVNGYYMHRFGFLALLVAPMSALYSNRRYKSECVTWVFSAGKRSARTRGSVRVVHTGERTCTQISWLRQQPEPLEKNTWKCPVWRRLGVQCLTAQNRGGCCRIHS